MHLLRLVVRQSNGCRRLGVLFVDAGQRHHLSTDSPGNDDSKKISLKKQIEEINKKSQMARKLPETNQKLDSKKPADSSSTSDDERFSSSSSSDDDRKSTTPQQKDKASQQMPEKALLGDNMIRAVDGVAKAMGGDSRKTKSDLLKKLIDHEKATYSASKTDQKESKPAKTEKEGTSKSLGALLSSMKVNREQQLTSKIEESESQRLGEEFSKKYQRYAQSQPGEGSSIRLRLSRQTDKTEGPKTYGATDFFDDGSSLEIFGPVAKELKSPEKPLLPVWENLEQRRLNLLTRQEPRNGFEELIRWTEEGKIWPYPIDNEYVFTEKDVEFHEHIFLDEQLENGFPATGPIRSFMELVVDGLSKNPYMTVEKKHSHIAWFRDYFKEKGAEIERLHALDQKHLQALTEIEATAASQENVSKPSSKP